MSDPLDSTDPPADSSTSGRLDDQIGHKADRRIKAAQERRHVVWFGLGMFGLVGWSVAFPTVIGTIIGVWLDDRFPGRTSWTLTLLIAGVVMGCLNAWRWMSSESEGPK